MTKVLELLRSLSGMKYFWHVLVGLVLVALIFFAGRSCGYGAGYPDGYKKGRADGIRSIDCKGSKHEPGPL